MGKSSEGATAFSSRPPLLVWAEMPFALADRSPHSSALWINRWQAQTLELVPWPTRPLPLLTILSLDPSDLLERAFSGVGIVLLIVRGRQDVPAGDRPVLLKLAGDLAARAGLWLCWQDVATTRNDLDKAYLLAEAAPVAQGGRVVVYTASADEAARRAWHELLRSSLPGEAEYLTVGPGAAAALSLRDGGTSLDAALAVTDDVPSPPAAGHRRDRGWDSC